MKIVCSPKGIVDKDRPRQGIMDIADAGFLDQGVICGLSEDETDGAMRHVSTGLSNRSWRT